MAAATVAIAHRRGLDVPGDLTVCGFDDTALATTIWPELTTIRQPVSEMARTAVDLLVKEIRARKARDARPTREPHVLGRLRADPPPVRRGAAAAAELAGQLSRPGPARGTCAASARSACSVLDDERHVQSQRAVSYFPSPVIFAGVTGSPATPGSNANRLPASGCAASAAASRFLRAVVA